MTEYGRIHTDGSRSGGQPLIANRKAHTMIIEVLAAWGIEPSNTTPEQLTIATTEALCRAIKQIEDLRQPIQSSVAAAPADRIGGAGVVTHGVVVDAQSDALQADALDFGNELIFACAGLRHKPINTEAIFSITWDGFRYDVTVRAAMQEQSK